MRHRTVPLKDHAMHAIAHRTRRSFIAAAAFLALAFTASVPQAQTDPLPSWNDGSAKRPSSISSSGSRRQGGPDFVPVEQRIAMFDNDGTLWSEQPMYVQVAFALDRVKALAPQQPGMEDQAAVQGGAERGPEGARRVRREGPRRAHHGHPCGHDDRGVRQDRQRLARDRAASALQPALHRARLPADARAARLPAGQRLQDLHRLRRRRRVHAAVDGEGLRHPARAGRRPRVKIKFEMRATASRC